ncbi:MAG: ammonium transporter [Actinomycetota bacterium]|nr:ammonium transporter [Actinomycetota bacterium]
MDVDTGGTAWVLTSAALVLLMTPGLAFFYGGMVRAKSVLNMIMMSLGSIGVVGVLWVLYGYSVAFGNDVGAGLLGSPGEYLGLEALLGGPDDPAALPGLAFVAFQAMFAILTVALVSGAIADRTRFGPWLLFAGLWATLVYFPVAHWVFAFDSDDGSVSGGWIANDLAALDFAGGTAVHINAGAAALALVLVLGRRRGWPGVAMGPHNLPFVVLGAGLLWFGWFGFNAGSAMAADNLAATAFVNTLAAPCAAMLGWLLVERIAYGKPTTLGAATGIVAGLVAITPACGSVTPLGALVIGATAGVACALAVGLKFRFGLDDSLDVVGIHLVGGLIGTLLVGLFATETVTGDPAAEGLFYGGGLSQLGAQALAAVAVLVYSFVLTLLIALLVKALVGFRADREGEAIGLDETEHAESAYEFTVLRDGMPSSRATADAGR